MTGRPLNVRASGVGRIKWGPRRETPTPAIIFDNIELDALNVATYKIRAAPSLFTATLTYSILNILDMISGGGGAEAGDAGAVLYYTTLHYTIYYTIPYYTLYYILYTIICYAILYYTMVEAGDAGAAVRLGGGRSPRND